MRRIPSKEQIATYGWHTIQDRALTHEEVSRVIARMESGMSVVPEQAVVRIVGNTPESGKHIITDSHVNHVMYSNGGLSFTLGVACIEAEAAKDVERFWNVCHPNGVAIYHVMWVDSGNVVVTRVG